PVPTAPVGGMSPADQYINDIYRDLFGRDAEAAGLGYWKGVLAAGDISVEKLEQAIRESARNEDLRKLRGFAVGTNYVPQDMDARIHQGERIIPEADNRELMSRLASPDRTASLLQELIAENRELREVVRSHLYPIAKNTGNTAKALDRVMPDGDAIVIREALPA